MRRAAATVVLAGMAFASAACGPQPPPSASTVLDGDSPAASNTAESAVPSATTVAQLRIDDLPQAELDPDTLTALCDPEPNQVHPDGGDTTVFCFDALKLAIRAVRVVTDATSRRAYVDRPECPAAPCPAASLDTATVVVWTDGGSFGVHIDSTLETLSFPESNVVGAWPFPGLFVSPPVRRGSVPAPAKVIATRDAYPYCGKAAEQGPVEVLECFRNSIIAGRPAEAVQETIATEGGDVVQLFRFGGTGAIERFLWADGRWVHQRGAIVLGPTEGTWSFDPWGKGELVQ